MDPAIGPTVRTLALAAAFVVWFLSFVIRRGRNPHRPTHIDRRARWGMLLEAIGYFIVFTHGPRVWHTPISLWRAVAGGAAAVAAIVLAWSGVVHLGKQWRLDAGINPDHELVQTGPYRWVRHPVYSSMLWILLTAIAWVGTLPGWVGSSRVDLQACKLEYSIVSPK